MVGYIHCFSDIKKTIQQESLLMNYTHAILLSIIEGITEYLPVSSTGHMIITSYFLGIEKDQFVQNYEVIIQFGAILSVLTIYWREFLQSFSLYQKLITAFIPTGIIGFLLKNKIENWLGSVQIVGWTTLLGGFILWWLDRNWNKKDAKKDIANLTNTDCIKLGLFQSLAVLPGTSRSGATIAGGMLLGMTRVEAARFSFFLAVPTLAAAGLLKIYKILPQITSDQLGLLTVGSCMAFLVAWATVKSFVTLVGRFGFRPFAFYRIILGAVILALHYYSPSR